MVYLESELGVLTPVTGRVYVHDGDNASTVYMDAGSYQHLLTMYVGRSSKEKARKFLQEISDGISAGKRVIRIESGQAVKPQETPEITEWQERILRLNQDESGKELSLTELFILSYMIEECRKKDACTSIRAVALFCHTTSVTVHKALKRLEKLGLVVLEKRSRHRFIFYPSEKCISITG